MLEHLTWIISVINWIKEGVMWILRRRKPQQQMQEVLEICQVTQKNPANEHRRIVVRNLLPTATVRFGASLDATKDRIEHDVPVRLQLTNTPSPCLEADIPPGQTHLVDVFVVEPGDERIGLLLATDYCVVTKRPFFIPRKRYEIRISVFTVTNSQVQGAVVSRSFYIIPQPDGSIIFSDAGS